MTAETYILLEKAMNYCSYSERSVQDVTEKLHAWNANSEQIHAIINQLKEENFINEARYVRAFMEGKIRNNQWGMNKILYALKNKNIPDSLVQSCKDELDMDEYQAVLHKILTSKVIKEPNDFKRRGKLAQYAMQKGFEADLIWKIINEIEKARDE